MSMMGFLRCSAPKRSGGMQRACMMRSVQPKMASCNNVSMKMKCANTTKECERSMPEKMQKPKEMSSSKKDYFKLIVNSQNAFGQFIDVETFIQELQSFDYKGIDKVIIQTFFIIQLLQELFKEFKTEWKLLVKKGVQWLNQQQFVIDDEMKQNIAQLIKSISSKLN